ncbi:MAG: 4-(cytidine 5'-diphospho)-2-C-methyl-D-erythritol kinase [Filomicrobium sp.]
MITEKSPAKVNLTLEILGRRADGYHEVRTLIAFARDVYDVVEFASGGPAEVRVSGPFAKAIVGENVADKALRLVAAAGPHLQLGTVSIEKRLPVAAGVGGGSANAAAILRALRRVNGDAGVDWDGIALSLGADVPVCLANRGAQQGGIGERRDGEGVAFPFAAVLVNPMQTVPADKTAQVFKRLAAPPFDPNRAVEKAEQFESAEAQLRYIRDRGNHLEPPALGVVPAIADVLSALRGLSDCRYAALSGAGPTCFGIFDGSDQADAAAGQLREAYPNWWVAATMLE